MPRGPSYTHYVRCSSCGATVGVRRIAGELRVERHARGKGNNIGGNTCSASRTPADGHSTIEVQR